MLTGHGLARELLDLDDLPAVHPGQGGDIYIETAYEDSKERVIVVADRSDTGGSEAGRRREMLTERARVMKLLNKRTRWLVRESANHPPGSPERCAIAYALRSLDAVKSWIYGGQDPDSSDFNPGESP